MGSWGWRWLLGLSALVLGLSLCGCDDYVPPDEQSGSEDDNNAPSGDDEPFACPDGADFCQIREGGFEEDQFLPFSTTTDYVTVNTGGGQRPIFIKGVNLGVGVPGTRAGHLLASKEDYLRWFERMSDIGINALRVYTLHYPRFYEAVKEHNQRHADRPLYILQGIWLFEQFEGVHLLTDGFRANVRELVDCAHGNCHIEHRFGKAYGTYEANISEWIMAWVVGREIDPHEVNLTNTYIHDKTSFEGEHFRAVGVQPFEVWWAEQLEFLVDYEIDHYNQTRPVSVSSWPTLDPLEHEVEGSKWTDEDVESFDMSAIEPVDAPGGTFATYHAYPYYPDFIINDPDFQEHADDEGPNSYLGYLTALRAHHADIPLFIGETGVSSSWGSAHWSYQRDMNHGGHTEVEQGAVNGRLFRNALAANTAGAAQFAWLDEWWKPTWITNPRGSADERRAFWHNVTAPEQNFGLIAFDVGPPPFEDGHTEPASGLVDQVTLVHDAAYFHVRLKTARALRDDEELVVAFDTYGDADSPQFQEELGESVLPNGVKTQRRNEFAIVIDGFGHADMMVTHAYDTYRIWHGTPVEGTLHRSTKTDGEDWNRIKWLNSQELGSNDKEYWFEEKNDEEIGKLAVRRADEAATSHDAVVVADNHIDIRVPWTLLNVVDPSRLEVLHNNPNTSTFETAVTRGIAVGVVHAGNNLVETARYSWQQWGRGGDITDIPDYTEREKPALELFGQALDDLPYWMD